MLPTLALLTLALPATTPQDEDLALERRITPVVRVVAAARPAVVYIQSDVPSEEVDFWGRVHKRVGRKTGTGVVIYDDGYIVTNYHVVAGASQMTVRFDAADDPKVYEAKLVSYVEERDMALLKIDGDQPFPTVPLSDSDPLLGETVIAIGNPYGQTHTVSTGIISGLHRDVQTENLRFSNLIQTDAAINRGNSGGPLLNINGELIGINTAMNLMAENIGFAIPVDQVKRVLNERLLSLSQARSWLGFDVDLASFTVREVVPKSPAELRGLRAGDMLLAIDGKPVRTEEEYRLARLTIQPDEAVALSVRRGADSRDVEIVSWNYLDGFLFERVGMTVERTLLGRGYQPYLKVKSVQDDGPAHRLGLAPGDILAAVRPDGQRAKRLRSPEELAFLVSQLESGTRMTVEIWRDDDGDGRFEREREYSELYKGTLEVL